MTIGRPEVPRMNGVDGDVIDVDDECTTEEVFGLLLLDRLIGVVNAELVSMSMAVTVTGSDDACWKSRALGGWKSFLTCRRIVVGFSDTRWLTCSLGTTP